MQSAAAVHRQFFPGRLVDREPPPVVTDEIAAIKTRGNPSLGHEIPVQQQSKLVVGLDSRHHKFI